MKYFLCLSMMSFMIIMNSCVGSRKMKNGDNRFSAFTEKELLLIRNGTSTDPMRVYKINNYQDSVLLRQQSQDVVVDNDNRDLSLFVDRLYATVRDSMSLGVGIAAPQVGVLKNIIWVQRFDKEGFPFEEYLNPRILQYSEKKQTRAEGCLSVPDRRETLNCRAYAVLLEYDRLDGSHHIEMVEDFTAIIFQHEIDHLNGIIYLDHLAQEINDANNGG